MKYDFIYPYIYIYMYMSGVQNPCWLMIIGAYAYTIIYRGQVSGLVLKPIMVGTVRPRVSQPALSTKFEGFPRAKLREFTTIHLGYNWLVVWNHGILWLSIQLGLSSSQLLLTPSFFTGVGQPPTRKWSVLSPNFGGLQKNKHVDLTLFNH